jgi:putative oxygen-independent coproporphyrinogen III oxidase
MEHGLYLHLPYCRSLCPYCAFAKAPLHRAEPERLLRALQGEWEMARDDDGRWGRPRTIFFGGGTPTALDPESLRRLLAWIAAAFDLRRVREWTAEANPEGLTDEKLAILRAGGVDRLSLGVQSLEPAALRALGRIHSPAAALDAITRARRAGFANLSVDLMVAVPGETPEGVRRAVETIVDLGVPHLSAYSLQVEEGTPLFAKVARGAVEPPGEEAAAVRYEEIAEVLRHAGYVHYEVSNWALPGFESRHNEGYWARRPYLGLGPGAHSFDGTHRWRNEEGVTRYYERVEAGSLPRDDRAPLSRRDEVEERIMLGLRRASGLRRGEMERLAGPVFAGWSQWAARSGAVRLDPPGRVRPTDRGLLLAQEISAELLARMDEAPRAPA